MKTLLHKLSIGLMAVTALFTAATAQAQIDYQQNFNIPSHGWTAGEFMMTNEATCNGSGALRAQIDEFYIADLPATIDSPSLGTSDGGVVTLEYAYKAVNYDQGVLTTATDPMDFGTLILQYATSVSGPWTQIDYVDTVVHTASLNCAFRTITFSPPAGSQVFLRFIADLGLTNNAKYYLYIDEISAEQNILGTTDIVAKPQIVAYPNPVSNYLTLSYDGAINGVDIFNMQGQRVSAANIDGDLSRLDFSALAYGNYIVKVSYLDKVETINVTKI